MHMIISKCSTLESKQFDTDSDQWMTWRSNCHTPNILRIKAFALQVGTEI